MALCHSQVTLMLSTDINIQKPHIPASFNMYSVINKFVTVVKASNFSGHYLRNRSTLGIGVLGYIGIVQHKEHSPEVLSIPPGTPCIYIVVIYILYYNLMGPPTYMRSVVDRNVVLQRIPVLCMLQQSIMQRRQAQERRRIRVNPRRAWNF